jgi:acetate kinase
MPPEAVPLLTVNSGSSSLKLALWEMGAGERRLAVGVAERLGLPEGHWFWQDDQGQRWAEDSAALADAAAGLLVLLKALKERYADWSPAAVGHRLVHGGEHTAPQRLTPALRQQLQELVLLAPDHLPGALKVLDACQHLYPETPQVVCFDTAFHRSLPRLAQLYPLPRRLAAEGILRYGFHGLSCEWVLAQLRQLAPQEAEGRLLIAHLGSGASLTAVRGGRSLDTTMGLTPAGGLMMGTRPGDLDPGVLLYLSGVRGLSFSELNDMINRQSGLLGVSGRSADMRDLLAHEASDPAAAEAIVLFCYQARKHLGALVAVLGGLDTLVFTGGIGEHAAAIRQRLCAGLEFLGLELDAERNCRQEPIISRPGSRVTVRLVPAEEDRMLARHTWAVLAGSA